MTSISKFMSDDHQRCDKLFSIAESAADKADWEATKQQTNQFLNAMQQHFSMEEDVLFIALEEATGMTQGPTQVMRHEHQQMRQLFEQLEKALDSKNQQEFLGITETLLIMMQQHNMKEEGILYGMCDQQLEGDVKYSVTRKLQEMASE